MSLQALSNHSSDSIPNMGTQQTNHPEYHKLEYETICPKWTDALRTCCLRSKWTDKFSVAVSLSTNMTRFHGNELSVFPPFSDLNYSNRLTWLKQVETTFFLKIQSGFSQMAKRHSKSHPSRPLRNLPSQRLGCTIQFNLYENNAFSHKINVLILPTNFNIISMTLIERIWHWRNWKI